MAFLLCDSPRLACLRYVLSNDSANGSIEMMHRHTNCIFVLLSPLCVFYALLNRFAIKKQSHSCSICLVFKCTLQLLLSLGCQPAARGGGAEEGKVVDLPTKADTVIVHQCDPSPATIAELMTVALYFSLEMDLLPPSQHNNISITVFLCCRCAHVLGLDRRKAATTRASHNFDFR